MTTRPAGARYPHATTDAREADHRFCPVLAAVAAAVAAGKESWGTPHQRAVPDEAAARLAVAGLYRARNHTSLKRRPCTAQQLSVRASWSRDPGGTCTVHYQVWSRVLAKQEIIRRVKAGEQLPYNVRRR